MPWVKARVAYLLAVQWATATIEDGEPGESDPNDYNEILPPRRLRPQMPSPPKSYMQR